MPIVTLYTSTSSVANQRGVPPSRPSTSASTSTSPSRRRTAVLLPSNPIRPMSHLTCRPVRVPALQRSNRADCHLDAKGIHQHLRLIIRCGSTMSTNKQTKLSDSTPAKSLPPLHKGPCTERGRRRVGTHGSPTGPLPVDGAVVQWFFPTKRMDVRLAP